MGSLIYGRVGDNLKFPNIINFFLFLGFNYPERQQEEYQPEFTCR
jgi:hypothetical protein